MSYGKIYVGEKAETLDEYSIFGPYDYVEVRKNSSSEPFHSGTHTDNGSKFVVNCEYASQAMADNIYNIVNGYSYQPYGANSVILEPAAELGDGVTVAGMYSGIFAMEIRLTHSYVSDISAMDDEELTHEYGYIGEDGKFATYASLANGTARVNGSGLIDGSVGGGAIASGAITGGSGGHIAEKTVEDKNVANSTLGSEQLEDGINTEIGNGQWAADCCLGNKTFGYMVGVGLSADHIDAPGGMSYRNQEIYAAYPSSLNDSVKVLVYYM